MAKGERISFILYFNSIALFDSLSDSDAGQLIKAIFHYKISGDIPDNLSAAANTAFAAIKWYLDEDQVKYEEICRKNTENGKLGGKAKEENRQERERKILESSER